MASKLKPSECSRRAGALLAVCQLVLFCGLLPGAALAKEAASAAPVTDPQAYARPAQISSFRVSPSNTHAALLVPTDEGYMALAVLDLARPADVKVLVAYRDADVNQAFWVNDKRLVFHASKPSAYAEYDGGGTFAIDLDGNKLRQLIAHPYASGNATGSNIHSRVLPFGWFPWRATDGRSDDILIYRVGSDRVGESASARYIARLNTRIGVMTALSFDQPAHANHWVFDAEGELRVVTSSHQGIERLHHRAPGQDGWAVLEEHPTDSEQVLAPLYIEGDGQLIVSTRRGRDTLAMYTYDTRTRKLGAEPLIAVDGFDIEGGFVADERLRQVVGVRVQGSDTLTVWFEDTLADAQKAVDSALPKGRSNLLLCGRCVGAERFVVRSSGPRQSAEYHVFHRKEGRLTNLGQARPWLPEASQGERSFHRVAARDGLVLPVVLTHPVGRPIDEPLPAVVMVHGGPWVRGTDLEWSAGPQFLAALGYRVIEVDFRGSTGLGWKHHRAGWKQWGQAMQDDLADALAWAVSTKAVDPQRVCIAGGSYGGYAALMGPVTHPGLYRCAVSHAGVTDLSLMFSSRGTDIPARFQRYGLNAMIGNPETDADMLRRMSPVNRVAEIKVPVLLAQGALDSRVTPVHADRFAWAARAAGVALERVDYAEEAHRWIQPRNHTDYLTRLQAFLARNIGSGASPASTSTASTPAAPPPR